MAETQPTPKKAKRNRKNYQKELDGTLQFCKVSIEVLESLKVDTDFAKGQTAAFRAVLDRVEK